MLRLRRATSSRRGAAEIRERRKKTPQRRERRRGERLVSASFASLWCLSFADETPARKQEVEKHEHAEAPIFLSAANTPIAGVRKMFTRVLVALAWVALACFLRSASAAAAEPASAATYDVVVYGGTSAGVIAAVQAKKMGRSAVIVCPDQHLGGLSSGGLGWTDTGNKAVIGGLAREFYHRVWKQYQSPEAWKWQSREEYGNKGQGTAAIDGEQRTMWIFEPHVAERCSTSLSPSSRSPSTATSGWTASRACRNPPAASSRSRCSMATPIAAGCSSMRPTRAT